MKQKEDLTLIHSRVEIVEKLTLLQKKECVLEVDFGDLGMLSTRILQIHEIEGSMLLSHHESAELNKKIVTSPSITFRAEFGFVEVAFTGKAIKSITSDEGKNVFLVDIPTSLHWVTRRRHDRQKIPVPNSSFCELLFPRPTTHCPATYKEIYPKVENQTLRLSLHDVSLSGFSMLNNDPNLSASFVPQMIFNNCKIILPDNKEIKISFEIMTKRKIESENGEFQELIGIKFLDIKHKLLIK